MIKTFFDLASIAAIIVEVVLWVTIQCSETYSLSGESTDIHTASPFLSNSIFFIYLPTLYNDKTSIEPKKYRQVKNKLQLKFGGLSVHPFTIQGTWINPKDNKRLYDNCARYEIVVEKSPENEEFFEKYKEELKELFQQHEIFMVFTEINWV